MFALAASVIISNTSIAASYLIQPGDTLQGVAYKFGVSYTELMKANPWIDPEYMKANPGIDSEYIKYGVRIELPERKVVQNQIVIHNVPKQPKQPKQPKPQPTPKPYAMQHTTPTGPTITIVEEETVY